MFHDMDDPLNPGRKVLVSNALKILKTEMGYVQKGLFSDIPGMPMYYATGKLSTGFETNRCVRGTPSLEGMHLHYRASQHPGAKASNLFNLNVHTNLWHWDWNVHGAVRAKLIPNIGHTDLWLVDAIIDALHGLDLKCVPFELRAWERTRTDVKPLTTIGVQFAQLGIVAKQLDHLPRTLLRKNIAAQLGTSDDAIDCIVKGDTPRLAKVFGVLTSMRHCEELERRAQETVATNNALNTCACPSGDEHTEGFRAYGAGASTATDSELRHAASRSAHLLRSEFRRPMIVAIVKPGASRLRGPLALQPLHPHWGVPTTRGVAQAGCYRIR